MWPRGDHADLLVMQMERGGISVRSGKISLAKQARSHGKQSTCTQMKIGCAAIWTSST
jgi:hypothetical protein